MINLPSRDSWKYGGGKFRKSMVLFQKDVQPFSPITGEDRGQVLRKETCKGPVSRIDGLILRHWEREGSTGKENRPSVAAG